MAGSCLKQFLPVASINDLKPGKGIKVHLKNKVVALFLYKGKIYALQNNCPHQNADLADGYIKDGKLFCSLHHWSFDLLTGAYSFNPKMQLNAYDVQIKENTIYIGFE